MLALLVTMPPDEPNEAPDEPKDAPDEPPEEPYQLVDTP